MLLDQLDVEVRSEFAERFAKLPGAPAGVMSRLAHDVIEVARPVLCHGETLKDSELIAVAMMRGQEHLRAIGVRTEVSTSVSDAVVSRGDDETLVTIVSNRGARFSRQSFETLTDRSERIVALQEPLATRPDTPLDLVNEMMTFVEDALRDRILKRVRTVPADELEEALRAARARTQNRRRTDPDRSRAIREVREMKARGKLNKAVVIDFIRGGDEARFFAGLAELVEVEFDAARRLWGAASLDPLAIAIRAADGDRAFFVTLAMEREGASVRDPREARSFGDAFEAIPVAAAQRVVRFWRVRRGAGEQDAA
jgi:uncharacterized protein (DUF2336 family)